jgi:hypothetical protein
MVAFHFAPAKLYVATRVIKPGGRIVGTRTYRRPSRWKVNYDAASKLYILSGIGTTSEWHQTTSNRKDPASVQGHFSYEPSFRHLVVIGDI